MKQLLSLFILICFILCLSACENTDINENTVVMPDSSTAETVNGYKSEKPIIKKSVTKIYIANTKTKKFHLDSCQYANSSNSENLTQTTDRESLINEGYSPCKKCNP